MNIQVRVLAGQATAAMRAMQAGLRGMNAQMLAGSGAARGHTRSLTAWGNQVQWTGRQIQTNWTLPLLAAAAAATHWELENQQAFTRISKVYGSAGMSAATLRNELEALDDAFQALSDHYGVQQKEVLDIAGDWAAAGASGIALARGVEATLQAMVLGEIEAKDATQALIAIQAQYGTDTKGLIKIIGTLNAVENETGVSMAGLIQGFRRSAGVARQAGVDYRHLAAMIAAISPAAGTAAEAGNALKTIFSRLASPTKETTEVLGLMGISMDDMNWKSANATEQLQILSKSFQGLSDKQKEVVSTVVASRWQINKFSILMRELASENGYYKKALDATADSTKVYAQYQRELNAVLSSNPHKVQQIWVMLQNASTDIIQPLIPILLYLMNTVRLLVTGFSNLDPALQKLILFGVLAVAMVGPITRYVGSLVTLIAALGTVAMWALAPIGLLISGFTGLVGLAWGGIVAGIGAVGAALTAFGTFTGVMIGRMFALIGMAIGRLVPLLISAWPTIMAAISTAITVGGAVIAGAWAALVYGLGAIFGPAARALLVAWRGMLLGMSILTTGLGAGLAATWRMVWVAMEMVLIASARIMGMIWRLATLQISVITMTWSAAFARLWWAINFLLQSILIAGARTLGVIWRGALALMTAITTAWRPVFAAAWAGLVAVARAGGTAMALATRLPRLAITALAMLPGLLATVFRGGWALLVLIARGGITALVSLIGGVISAIGWPVIAAIAAVVLLVAGFWDQIKAVFNNIVAYFSNSGSSLATAARNIFGSIGTMISKVFNKMPESVKNAMVAVVRLVAAAARKVYELFSYINPFAHHSPSLVENVTNGMAEVRKQFSTLSDVEKYVMSAYNTLQKFGGVAASMGQQQQEAEWSDQRSDIAKVKPSALPAFDALTNQVRVLTPILNQLESAVNAQQQVVDGWKKKLDAANKALDVQQDKLDKLRDAANALSDQLNDAKSQLDDWASTPIKGQQAMSDAIFENEMAQKRLQLEMMKMEEVTGPLEDIKSKMSAINGEIDTLQGIRGDLQKQGAGSDILGVYDEQLKQLEGSKGGLTDQAKALQEMQDQLDELARQGQKLDLENSIQFDPLIRQIEQASKDMKEMPFDVILAGVQASKVKVDELTKAYEAANQAVKDQQAVVDAATAARDAIQARYDTENEKLQKLKDAYDAVNDAIQRINDSLQKMSSMASDSLQRKEAKKKKKGSDSLSPGAQNFLDAEGGNFADVGSDMEIGREGGLGDQSGQIKDFTADLAKETAGMFAGLNPLTPLKKWWDKAWNWLKTYIGPLFTGLGDFLSAAFEGIPNPFSGASDGWAKGLTGWIEPAKEMFRSLVSTVVDIFTTLWGWVSGFWEFAQPLLEGVWDALVGGLKSAWEQIWPQIAQFKDLLAPIGEAFSNLWTIVKPILMIVGGSIAAVFLLLIDIVKNTLGPVLEMIGGIIAAVIQVLRGIIEFIVGVFTLDWDMVWKGITDIFGGVWNLICSIVEGAIEIVLGILYSFMEWLGQIFKFVWDKAIVPAWEASWKWISQKATTAWDGIVDFFVDIKDWFGKKFAAIWDSVSKWWSSTWSSISTNASNAWKSITQPFKDAYNWLDKTFKGIMDSVSARWKSTWKGLRDWFEDAKKWISNPLKDGVNLAISAINLLIKGLNKVADLLPGLDWNIPLIPKLAMGGGVPNKRVGPGFRTSGARAIVGEGNPRYPEYVIPTDPMYRRRARGLFGSLAADLGVAQHTVNGVPAYKGGGILDTIGDAIGDAGDFFKGLGDDLMSHISDGVASYIVDPFFKLADPYVKKINWKFVRGMWNAGKLKIKDWLKFTDDATKQKYDEGGSAAVPAGKIKDWIVKALNIIKEPMSLSKGIYNIIMHESGGNPRAINLWDINAKNGTPSKGLMQTIDPTFNAYSIKGHKDIWNPIDNIIAGTRYAISRYGRKWLEAGGNKDKNGNYIGYEIGGVLGMLPGISKAVPSLAEGAYIRRTVGGTLVRVGEGQTDEAVVPLPNGMRDFGKGGGETHNHFYGDLSFPNITSADDAKRFIENLEDLAAG